MKLFVFQQRSNNSKCDVNLRSSVLWLNFVTREFRTSFLYVCKQKFRITPVHISQNMKVALMRNLEYIVFYVKQGRSTDFHIYISVVLICHKFEIKKKRLEIRIFHEVITPMIVWNLPQQTLLVRDHLFSSKAKFFKKQKPLQTLHLDFPSEKFMFKVIDKSTG